MLYKQLTFNHVDHITATLRDYYAHLLDKNAIYAEIIEYQTIKQLVPELIKQFEDRNLSWDIARVFISPQNDGLSIHIDGNDDHPKHSAINWPLANYDQSTMTWYNILDYTKFFYAEKTSQRYGNNVKFYHRTNCVPIDSLTITEPTLIRIDTAHDVVNHSNQSRMVISFRFKPEPLHLWK